MTIEQRRRRAARSILASLWLATAGCGSSEPTIPVHPTSGRLLTAGGKPAAGATVAFHPVERAGGPLPFVPHGQVDGDGNFRLTSYAAGDGAPEGNYAVTVTWRTADPYGDPIGPDRLKGRYADPKTPLGRAVVRVGENRLDPLQLK